MTDICFKFLASYTTYITVLKLMKFLLLSSAMLLTLAGAAQAQITWAGATGIPITGPSDVIMTGSSYVDAISANNTGADETVGDTTFHHSFNDGTLSFSNVGGGSDGSASPTPSATSAGAAAYNLSLIGCAYQDSPQTGFIVLGSTANPLTLNATYQVEIWDSANAPGRETTFTDGSSVTLDPSVAANGSGTGEYAVGTFTATALSETISFQSTPGSYAATYGEVNDVALRLVNVPEPSTYAMIGIGLLSLFALGKFRKLTI